MKIPKKYIIDSCIRGYMDTTEGMAKATNSAFVPEKPQRTMIITNGKTMFIIPEPWITQDITSICGNIPLTDFTHGTESKAGPQIEKWITLFNQPRIELEQAKFEGSFIVLDDGKTPACLFNAVYCEPVLTYGAVYASDVISLDKSFVDMFKKSHYSVEFSTLRSDVAKGTANKEMVFVSVKPSKEEERLVGIIMPMRIHLGYGIQNPTIELTVKEYQWTTQP